MITTLPRSGYAPVNGLQLYYEMHGTGEPLLLLHGGLASGEMFAPFLQAWSHTRHLITVDLQAHGRTADRDRALSYEELAADVAAFIRYLGVGPIDLLGYSLSGGVALQTACRCPDLLRKLIVVSAPYASSGWYPEVRAAFAQLGPPMAEAMKASALYQRYAALAPQPSNWTQLVTKIRDLETQTYDWSAQVAALTTPTMLVFADADAVHPAHVVHFYQLLGGGQQHAGWDGAHMPVVQVAVLPGCTHYNLCSSPLLLPAVRLFLDN